MSSKVLALCAAERIHSYELWLKYKLIVIRAISATTQQVCTKVFQVEGGSCDLLVQSNLVRKDSSTPSLVHTSHLNSNKTNKKTVCVNRSFINLGTSMYTPDNMQTIECRFRSGKNTENDCLLQQKRSKDLALGSGV